MTIPAVRLPSVTGIKFLTAPITVTVSGCSIKSEMANVHILAMLCSKPEMKKQKTKSIMVKSFAPSPLRDIGMKKARHTSQLHSIPLKNSSEAGGSILCSAR